VKGSPPSGRTKKYRIPAESHVALIVVEVRVGSVWVSEVTIPATVLGLGFTVNEVPVVIGLYAAASVPVIV
jgi:hypothetical protein